MFYHRKETIIPVNVGTPDARFGTFLLEQFGGATGELTAALQYWVQSFHVTDASIRDMLQPKFRFENDPTPSGGLLRFPVNEKLKMAAE
jgi:Manganese containing catalase